MRHTILTTLLTLGVIGGLTYGIIEHRRSHWDRHARFKDRVADICVEATLRTLDNKSARSSGREP